MHSADFQAGCCAGAEQWAAAAALKCWAAWLQLCALDGHARMPSPVELAQTQVGFTAQMFTHPIPLLSDMLQEKGQSCM